jgi:alpha-acetolactate decarboxylase
MDTINKLYNTNNTAEITQAVKVEIPNVYDIVVDFAKTRCGRLIFSKNATDAIQKASEIMRTANITVEIYTYGRNRVYVNGLEISSYLGIQGYYYKMITDAQKSG